MSTTKIEEKFGKDKVVSELKETLEHKLVQRLEAPWLGLVFFSLALWGSKIFTLISPGTSLIFEVGGFTIHLHHFHYGILALIIGIILTFFEGDWFVRIEHSLFGAGLGFIVDEYWLLLIFDDSTYFGQESQFISIMIGLVISIIYIIISIGVYFRTKEERKLWKDLYDAVKSERLEIDI